MVRVEALQAEIEKRKQAEVTLRETEQKLRNILENSTNLFYMHGTDHVFTYMSPQRATVAGCGRKGNLARERPFILRCAVTEPSDKHNPVTGRKPNIE